MGRKEEELMNEILERIGRIEENIQNMQFAIIQIQGMMGKGKSSQGSGISENALKPIADKLNRIESLLESQGSTIGMGTGSGSFADEIVKANQNVVRALETIEKGLKVVDIEVTMIELRDRLEELLMNLESRYMTEKKE